MNEWAMRSLSPRERAHFFSEKWHNRRQIFEAHFLSGTSFFYSALSLGGPPLSKYGLLNLRLSKAWERQDAALLPGDSLRLYWDTSKDEAKPDEAVDDARLPSEAAGVLEHALLGRGAKPATDASICRSEDGSWYIERISIGGPRLTATSSEVASVSLPLRERKKIIDDFLNIGTPETEVLFTALADLENLLMQRGVQLVYT